MLRSLTRPATAATKAAPTNYGGWRYAQAKAAEADTKLRPPAILIIQSLNQAVDIEAQNANASVSQSGGTLISYGPLALLGGATAQSDVANTAAAMTKPSVVSSESPETKLGKSVGLAALNSTRSRTLVASI